MCSKAAVGFDATDQKFVVINSENLDATDSSEGDAVDIDGRALTILQICASVEEAKASCEQKACKMLDLNGMGLASITYDDDEPQSSSSGTDAKEFENASLDDQDTIEGMDNDMDADNTEFPPIDTTTLFSDYSMIADLQQQIDGLRGSVRNAVSMLCADLQSDIEKVALKQQRILTYIEREFSIEKDGRIVEPIKANTSGFDGATFDMGSIHGKSRLDDYLLSHMEESDRERRERMREIQSFVKRGEKKMKPNFVKPAPKSSAVNRKDREREKDLLNGDADFSFGTPGTQGKRIVNGVVQTVEKLNYPFITKECEEQCLEESNGQAPIYAQMLAKVLFNDSIELYFKDQETTKRNWLHDAVDYRFPTLDKASHVSKWKNCSYFINKNMREAVLMSGNPMPRAPCGPRGPIGPKDRVLNVKKENFDEQEEEEESPVSSVAISEKTKENLHPKQKTASVDKAKHNSKPPNSYKFLTMNYEKECFEECRGEQYKYAELMALKLFSESLENKFKEQDVTKKEWLRHCVESRFPIMDRDKNDQRWKICGQTCNRNRTKVVGADGREEKYPYFGQDIEEECFKKSGGVASVYAELMNAKLFPDTQYLFFKDQHIGRRNWLHSILDKRFPTTDKAAHVSKWKTCTNSINRKLFDGTVTPLTKEQSAAESLPNGNVSADEDETPSTSTSTPAVTTSAVPTPRAPVPKFERKPPSDGNQNGGLKRKLDDTISDPSPSSKRESVRNKIRKEKVAEMYSSYPFITEEEEIDIFECSNGNPQSYGRELGRVLFKDTLKLYFKDQDIEKRQWIKEILDFRFPPKNIMEQKQKWKNVMAAINKNMTAVLPPRKSLANK